MKNSVCTVPEHEWLVLEMDDMLDAVDPVGIVCDRPRAHEYIPEIPDLIRLIIEGNLTVESVKTVFDQFFGEGVSGAPKLQEVLERMEMIRDDWKRLIERTANPELFRE